MRSRPEIIRALKAGVHLKGLKGIERGKKDYGTPPEFVCFCFVSCKTSQI